MSLAAPVSTTLPTALNPKASFQEILRTINSTRVDIVRAKERRVAAGKARPHDDLSGWDNSIREAESALTAVEKLAEEAHLDMQHRNGQVRTKTKLKWAMRDSKSTAATYGRLTISHTRMLSTTMISEKPLSPGSSTVRFMGETPSPIIAHQEDTKKAIAMRRQEDEERIASLLTPNSDHQRPPSSATDTGPLYQLGQTAQSGYSLGSLSTNNIGASPSLPHPPKVFFPATVPEEQIRTPVSPTTSTNPHQYNRVPRLPSQQTTTLIPVGSVRFKPAPSTTEPLAIQTDTLPGNSERTSPFSAPPMPTELASRRTPTPPQDIDELDDTTHPPSPYKNKDELFIPAGPSVPSRSFLGQALSPSASTTNRPRSSSTTLPAPQPGTSHDKHRSFTLPDPRAPRVPPKTPFPNPPYPLSRQPSARLPHEHYHENAGAKPSWSAQTRQPEPPRERHPQKPDYPPVPSTAPRNNTAIARRSFAGHRAPVEVRWRPYGDNGQGDLNAQDTSREVSSPGRMHVLEGHETNNRASGGKGRVERDLKNEKPRPPYPDGDGEAEPWPYSPDDYGK